MPVYPKGMMPYGQDIVAAHAQHHKADYVFTLIDAWIYNSTPFFETMSQYKKRWIPYFPIDSPRALPLEPDRRRHHHRIPR
jgi:hypothetical protein